MKNLYNFLDKKIDYYQKEDGGAAFAVFKELMSIRLYLNQFKKDTFELTDFDIEENPGEEYLKLTFRAKPEDVKNIIKKRRYFLGGIYSILEAVDE
jgi:hypothetical protein